MTSPLERQRLAAKRRIAQAGLAPRCTALPRQAVATCDACGEPAPWIVETEDRYGLPMRVMVCPRCTLIAQADRMNPDSAAVFYRDLYRPLISAFHGRTIRPREVYAESRMRASEVWGVLREYADEVRGRAWVDVGGGTGGSIDGLAERGIEPASVCIVDPAGAELAVAEQAGYEVYGQIAEDGSGWSDGRFDLLLCLQTLDHVLDLRQVVTNIHRALRPGGLAVVTVADYLLVHRDRSWMDLKLDHTYFFSRRALDVAARRAGLVPERLAVCTPGTVACAWRRPETTPAPPAIPPLAGDDAERALRLALTPACRKTPMTLRKHLYRVKRRWQRLAGR